MASFVTLRCTNGKELTLNVSLIEWWRPVRTGINSHPHTDVAYKGGMATVAMTSAEFADLIRQAHADVVTVEQA